MKRVLTVGCSFTFGEELADPKTSAWPHLLGQANAWEINNQGQSGGSNDRNVRVCFEEVSNKYDLIIVAWTVHERIEVPSARGLLNLGLRYAEKANLLWAQEYFAKHYDRMYNYQRWLRQVIMLQSYFKQINQPYLFLSTFGMWSDLRLAHYDEYMKKLQYLVDQVDSTYYVDWPKWGMVDWQGDCPRGPGGHPLELGHERIAERINEHIRHLGWLS